MYYWNQDNFEGLIELADSLKADPRLVGLAEYCTLREQGLRRHAFDALERFLAEAARWEPAAARELALTILDLHHRAPRVHQFLAEPLVRRLLLPVLKCWHDEGGASPAALRELGFLSMDDALVERALERDPEDVLARERLINRALHAAEYAMHHLDESVFIGSESDAASSLGRARTLLARAPSPEVWVRFADALSHLEQVLADWLEFKETGAGAFPDWCRTRGRKYSWPRKYYYSARRGRVVDADHDG